MVERRTGKADQSRITTGPKFQAKALTLHLVGRREPPQVTGLQACVRGKAPAAMHGMN